METNPEPIPNRTRVASFGLAHTHAGVRSREASGPTPGRTLLKGRRVVAQEQKVNPNKYS